MTLKKKGGKDGEEKREEVGGQGEGTETAKTKKGSEGRPVQLAFKNWGDLLKMQGSVVGASERLGIALDEMLSEDEAMGYIEKYRGGSPEGK